MKLSKNEFILLPVHICRLETSYTQEVMKINWSLGAIIEL
jgi:hypothetical protein